MARKPYSLTLWAGVATMLFSIQAYASDRSGQLTEEFHQTYPLSTGGRVALNNINGAVHITGWDRSEVKVDAVKYAYKKERLVEAKIKVDASSSRVSIRTEYPERDHTFNWGSHDNPAGVEYTITLPRSARLDKIELINGALDIQGVTGEVAASCINGRLSARDLGGRAELSTVNGSLEAEVAQTGREPVDLSSVNGSVTLTLPSNAQVELEATTVHGGISNNFGLKTNNDRWVGHDLRGRLGNGGSRIKLNNVNGRIEIRHANDGRTVSPAKSLNNDEDDDTI